MKDTVMTKRLLVALLGLTVFFVACRKEPGPAAGPKKSFKIAVIPKGLTHEFWKSIHAGAVKASQDLAADGLTVEIIWKGPLREHASRPAGHLEGGQGGVPGLRLEPGLRGRHEGEAAPGHRAAEPAAHGRPGSADDAGAPPREAGREAGRHRGLPRDPREPRRPQVPGADPPALRALSEVS